MLPDMSRPSAAVDATVQTLSRALLAKVDGLGADLAARIQQAESVYRDGHVPPEDLRRSCRDNLVHVFTRLAGRRPPGLEAPRATGRRRAEQGVPLPAILHAYRIGGRYIWETLLGHAPESGPARDELLRAAADIWTIVDDYSNALTDAYRDTIAEQARRNAQLRTAALSSLLDGTVSDAPRLWESAAMLQLPHRGTFVVVAAEASSPGYEALPKVGDLLRRHDVASAWRLGTEVQVGVVSLRPRFTVAQLCQRLAHIAGGRVGVSEPYTSLDQTAQALRQARLACAAAARGAPEPIRYEQQPIGVLLASAPDAGSNVAQAILGPVLALPASDRDILLETLRTWFAEKGSVSAAAARLHIHRNTVRYRLRRLENVTSRSLGDPKAIGELYLALESIHIHGIGPAT
jgi:hypothetical protein